MISISRIPACISVTRIGFFAFDDCVSLKSLKLPSTLKKIDDCAFADCGFTKIKVPAKTKTIGKYAFQYCKKMKSIKIPKKARLIGGKSCVFFECKKKLKIKYY